MTTMTPTKRLSSSRTGRGSRRSEATDVRLLLSLPDLTATPHQEIADEKPSSLAPPIKDEDFDRENFFDADDSIEAPEEEEFVPPPSSRRQGGPSRQRREREAPSSSWGSLAMQGAVLLGLGVFFVLAYLTIFNWGATPVEDDLADEPFTITGGEPLLADQPSPVDLTATEPLGDDAIAGFDPSALAEENPDFNLRLEAPDLEPAPRAATPTAPHQNNTAVSDLKLDQPPARANPRPQDQAAEQPAYPRTNPAKFRYPAYESEAGSTSSSGAGAFPGSNTASSGGAIPPSQSRVQR